MIQSKIIFNGLLELTRGLNAVERAVSSGDLLVSVGRAVARESQSTLRRLTPAHQQSKSRTGKTNRIPGDFALRDLWMTLEVSVHSFRYEALVVNRAETTPEGTVILRSLEKGAQAHDMPGPKSIGVKNGHKVYAWNQPGSRRSFVGRTQSGGLLTEQRRLVRRRTDRVVTVGPRKDGRKFHPGHKAFGMVERSHDHMRSIMGIVAQLAMTEYLNRYVGLTAPAVNFSVSTL